MKLFVLVTDSVHLVGHFDDVVNGRLQRGALILLNIAEFYSEKVTRKKKGENTSR
jgi:hypothetical protein